MKDALINCSSTSHASSFSISDLCFIFKRRFYDQGYQDGFSHGRIHGLIEGRALGREKGFEIWEELGFYEGFAKTWMAVLLKQGRLDECVLYSFFLSYFSINLMSLYISYFNIWIIYSPPPSGVHHSTSDTSSTPSPNSRASTPPPRIPLLTRSTSRNSSAKFDRVIKCSVRPSAYVRGCRVPKSQPWRTKSHRIEWTKTRCLRELPRALLYQCGRSIRGV